MRPFCLSRPWTGLLLAVLWAVSPALGAQEREWSTRETLPGSVVLVLKLLDAAHARPTTGVVISDEGLVLVPAEFVAAGDELVVLDGGSDVFRNGRPARTVHRSAEAGIAVLAVDGLRRESAPLAMQPVTGTLHFAAFPAAEQLTEGALPLWVALEAGATEPDLPGLPGPLLDRCGHLAGYATGGDTSRVLDSASLGRALQGFGLSLPGAACGAAPAAAAESPAVADTPANPTLAQTEPAPAQPPAADDSSVPDSAGDAETPSPQMSALDGADAPSPADSGMPPETRQAFAVTLATTLGLLAWWWFRWRRRGTRPSGEPETVELLPARATDTEPAAASTGAALTGRRLRARLPDGKTVEHALPGPEDFSVVVGRAGDVALDHPSLSRTHVNIESDQGGLWIRDLGTTNGTLVGRVPCLPGEVMRWSPGTTLLLGEVALTLLPSDDDE